KARAGLAALVDDRVHVAVGDVVPPLPPRGGDQVDLALLEVGERAHVARTVDDDLLPLEGSVEVRNHADCPVALLGEAERLRRRALLVAGAEGALVELLLGRRRDRPAWGSRPPAAGGRDRHQPPRERVAPELAAQLPRSR